MNSQPILFYQQNYSKLVQDLGAISEPSVQEAHNLAISKYLLNGENPLPALQKVINNIKIDNSSSWPQHQSYPLIVYHTALYYFRSSQYDSCEKVLIDIWDNSDRPEKIIMLLSSLLSIELYIRANRSSCLAQAQNYLRINFPTQDSITTFISNKGLDKTMEANIIDLTLNSKIRLDVAAFVRNTNDQKLKNAIHSYFSTIDISEKACEDPKLSVAKAIPLAAAAFAIGDKTRFNAFLESAENNSHYAVQNNLGIYEMICSRYNSSILHFSMALNSSHNKQLVYPFHQVAYNLGLSMLMKGKPRRAFKYFYSVIPLMHDSPYLWLRLSESIVSYYRHRVQKIRQRTQHSPTISAIYSTDCQTFYLLPPLDSKVFERDPQKCPEMSLVFASQCAKNCLTICNNRNDKSAIIEKASLLCGYLCLESGDGKGAEEHVRPLLSTSLSIGSGSISGINRNSLLAKVYAAQGMLLTGGIEAMKALHQLLLEWYLSKENTLLTLANLINARAAMVQGDTKKAEQALARVADDDQRRPEVILTRAAFELKCRHTAQAVAELKEYSAVADQK